MGRSISPCWSMSAAGARPRGTGRCEPRRATGACFALFVIDDRGPPRSASDGHRDLTETIHGPDADARSHPGYGHASGSRWRSDLRGATRRDRVQPRRLGLSGTRSSCSSSFCSPSRELTIPPGAKTGSTRRSPSPHWHPLSLRSMAGWAATIAVRLVRLALRQPIRVHADQVTDKRRTIASHQGPALDGRPRCAGGPSGAGSAQHPAAWSPTPAWRRGARSDDLRLNAPTYAAAPVDEPTA